MNRIRKHGIAVMVALCAAPILAAAQQTRVAWAEVIEARPVHQEVRIPVREDVCWDEEVQYAVPASVAADQQRRKYPDRYYVTTEQRCETQTRWRLEDRIVGWDVRYEFHGEIYQARVQDAPGDRIQVRVGVQPVGS
jgi:uncharacterized protein YcfJ